MEQEMKTMNPASYILRGSIMSARSQSNGEEHDAHNAGDEGDQRTIDLPRGGFAEIHREIHQMFQGSIHAIVPAVTFFADVVEAVAEVAAEQGPVHDNGNYPGKGTSHARAHIRSSLMALRFDAPRLE